jgi:hypothetical protein
LILTALVPYWDAARTVNRFALLGGLGLIVLAAQGLQRFPRVAQYLLAAIWLIEVLPMPTGNYPMPERPHPAYEWLAQQELGDEGIVDLLYPTIYIRGETLFATWFHRTPTAAGVGSFWPQHTFFLWQLFVEYPQTLSTPDVYIILEQYDVRYLFLHLKGTNEHDMWDAVSNNPAFRPVDCFAPPDEPSPWAYPICVAEVVPSGSSIQVIRQEGWSGLETWGVWAQADRSQALWLATSQTDHTLSLEAFPLCLPDRQQDISIAVNGTRLSSYHWQACESWSQEIVVPAAVVTPGWNTLTFDYGYAASSEGDPRPLAVGFTRLEVAQP